MWKEGCLLASLAADAAGSSRVVSSALRKRTSELRTMLVDLLGPLATPKTTAADLADQFLVCIEGAVVLARIHGDAGYLQRSLEQFRRCLVEADRRGA